MKLSKYIFENPLSWQEKGFILPAFDRDTMRRKSREKPRWLHFGAGNLFRAFPLALLQDLLEAGKVSRGVFVADTFDPEILELIFTAYDDLSIQVVLHGDGTVEKRVLASLAGTVRCSGLEEIFTAKSLELATFTVTEKSYVLADADGALLPWVRHELEEGPEKAESLFAIIAALCLARYRSGAAPLALVSLDNCGHNGDKLRDAVYCFVDGWYEYGYAGRGFVNYMKDGTVSFPISMIDKITPNPSPEVQTALERDGLEDAAIRRTKKGTSVAPFTNAEETGYLVIEDSFPNGRPPLEEAGVIFTDRDTVIRAEAMKVGTCLNPVQLVLSVAGALLEYPSIAACVEDTSLVSFVYGMVENESMPVAVDPSIINPAYFFREAMGKRLPNRCLPDTPYRINTDLSQKFPSRFSGTLKAIYARDGTLAELEYIPFFFALWFRYLLGVSDRGVALRQSPDPLMEELREALSGLRLGAADEGQIRKAVLPLLQKSSIWGLDLCSHGLSEKVIACCTELFKGPGAVREVLDKRAGFR